MSTEWTRLCKGARDLAVDGDQVEVRFAHGRRHQLSIEDSGNAYHVAGLVAKPGVAGRIDDLALHVWRRNRATALAGFRIDARGRVWGESVIPKPGLTAAEFQQWIRVVAAECDRFEHQLAGTDER